MSFLNRLRPLKSQGSFCQLRGKEELAARKITLIIRRIKSRVKVSLYYRRRPSGTIESTTPLCILLK
jgi:hypothetical protein